MTNSRAKHTVRRPSTCDEQSIEGSGFVFLTSHRSCFSNFGKTIFSKRPFWKRFILFLFGRPCSNQGDEYPLCHRILVFKIKCHWILRIIPRMHPKPRDFYFSRKNYGFGSYIPKIIRRKYPLKGRAKGVKQSKRCKTWPKQALWPVIL